MRYSKGGKISSPYPKAMGFTNRIIKRLHRYKQSERAENAGDLSVLCLCFYVMHNAIEMHEFTCI